MSVVFRLYCHSVIHSQLLESLISHSSHSLASLLSLESSGYPYTPFAPSTLYSVYRAKASMYRARPNGALTDVTHELTVSAFSDVDSP